MSARLDHFGDIGTDLTPRQVYDAFGYVRKAAALAKRDGGAHAGVAGRSLSRWPTRLIEGEPHSSILRPRNWQTGLNTQTNMRRYSRPSPTASSGRAG